MPLTRLHQVWLLFGPTARAIGWGPPLWAAIPAILYVSKEAPGAYVNYRVLVLRIGALLLCMGSAFILDDPTEDTVGHVPTPLLLRRGLRVVLVLPVVALAWAALVRLAGDVPIRDGGPLPVGDLTLEGATLLLIALSAACLGARLTSDRLGGVVAAPIVLACVAAAMFLPADHKLILSSISDPRWDHVHDLWRFVLLGAGLAFLFLNRSSGSYRTLSRLRATKAVPSRLGPCADRSRP